MTRTGHMSAHDPKRTSRFHSQWLTWSTHFCRLRGAALKGGVSLDLTPGPPGLESNLCRYTSSIIRPNDQMHTKSGSVFQATRQRSELRITRAVCLALKRSLVGAIKLVDTSSIRESEIAPEVSMSVQH